MKCFTGNLNLSSGCFNILCVIPYPLEIQKGICCSSQCHMPTFECAYWFLRRITPHKTKLN